MRFSFPILILALLLSSTASAQFHRKYKDYGDKLLEKGDVSGALKNYYMGMQIDSGDASLNYAYANALRLSNSYKKALHYYYRTTRIDRSRKYVEAYHYAGEMSKILGDYKASMKYHNRFVKRFKGDKQKYEYRKSLMEVENSRQLIHLIKDSVDVDPNNNHPINTVYSEYSPYLVNDTQLLFASIRSDSLKNRLVLDSSRYFSRIRWGLFTDQWQDDGLHDDFHVDEQLQAANPFYSPKQDFVYYTECSAGRCVIVRARNKEGSWEDFEVLPEEINMPGFTSTQPSLARIDGLDYLFFVSDRPNGYGKLDIWYTIAYSNGLFEAPVNLGDSVNSPGNDITPYFMEEEAALYFSSDWYMGLGGFDVFRCQDLGEDFTSPENLGTPFNSSYNDLYFRQRGNQSVMASNREGSKTDKYANCCNDLYFFEYKPQSIKPEIEMSKIERIERLLPLRLFFHNDEPNPRSRDTSTTILYSSTYLNYLSKESTYEREYARGLKGEEEEEAKEEIAYFFESEVKLGYGDLKEAFNLLLELLEEGEKIELTIKGYASPLSAADYNRRLTLRRISSVINEIEHFKQGALGKFIQRGSLKITAIPFGEDRLSGLVSDDLNDKRNAIYSKRASFERRVEIISIKEIR